MSRDLFTNRRGSGDDDVLNRALASWRIGEAPQHIMDNVMNEIGLRPQVAVAARQTVIRPAPLQGRKRAWGGLAAVAAMAILLVMAGINAGVQMPGAGHVAQQVADVVDNVDTVEMQVAEVTEVIDEADIDVFVAELTTPLEEEASAAMLFDELFALASMQTSPEREVEEFLETLFDDEVKGKSGDREIWEMFMAGSGKL